MKRLLTTLVLAGLSVVGTGCERDNTEKDIREAVLSYMAQPHFVSSDFTEQVTDTGAELQRFRLDEGMLYFSVPSGLFDKNTLEKLTQNPDEVEFAKKDGNRLVLGRYKFRAPGEYFFRFPSEDFRIDSTRTIEVPYRRANYALTLEELTNFSNNGEIFGGRLYAIEGRLGRRNLVIANHGAFVARPNEPSLTRFVNEITQKGETDETLAQDLLDFVTQEIEYGGGDDVRKVEVLKRPNEVLMTRASDCSGMTILYASLLEQTGIDYRLVYLPGHITVAVNGNFPEENGLAFRMQNQNYSIAEVTISGFQIGRTRIRNSYAPSDIEYVQNPEEDSQIIDFKTKKPLKFE